ncbi:putative membrane protein [Rhodopirellula sp. SWK7]|nr:putative membrane protein [Rhodopirellula sp. SWK7]
MALARLEASGISSCCAGRVAGPLPGQPGLLFNQHGFTVVKKHVTRQLSFLRATAIGGIFFLLPFAVLCFFLGQIAQVVVAIAVQIQPILRDYLGINHVTGYALIFAIALLLIILACFIAGMLASRSVAKQFTGWVEKYLLMMFPRYAIFKEQLSGNIGGDISKNRLKPVHVRLEGYSRIAFEVERSAESDTLEHAELVTVFLPGSPDPWNGTVINVTPDRVEPITSPFPDVLGAFEKLGLDSQKILRGESVHG